MTDFALIGAAGFIAPRHMAAIRATGNRLVAALDPSDSVGVIDSHFPEAHFFTEFERFDRHLDKLRRRGGEKVGMISICSPNYLHDSHVRFALRSDADAICEKPLVLNPWNIDGLAEVEAATGRRCHTILQLRVHPAIEALKARLDAEPSDAPVHEVDLTYITGRGRWYAQSWKGDQRKSGGIATNIGIHFFDMLGHLFGELRGCQLHASDAERAAGFLDYARARVRWFLSVDIADIPEPHRAQRTYRAISLDGEAIEFSDGFTDLHTLSYRRILAGEGFGIEESRPAIELVSRLRSMPVAHAGERHPLLRA